MDLLADARPQWLISGAALLLTTAGFLRLLFGSSGGGNQELPTILGAPMVCGMLQFRKDPIPLIRAEYSLVRRSPSSPAWITSSSSGRSSSDLGGQPRRSDQAADGGDVDLASIPSPTWSAAATVSSKSLFPDQERFSSKSPWNKAAGDDHGGILLDPEPDPDLERGTHGGHVWPLVVGGCDYPDPERGSGGD
ncbi:hypothetical protein ACQ4PT_050718 [Festuca glaucescens]